MTCGSDLPCLVSDFSGDWMITRNHVRVVDLYRWPMIPVNSFVSIFSIGWRQHHLLYYLRDVNVLLAASFLPDDCENMCTPSYYNYQREIWTQPMFRVGPWIKSALYVLLYSQVLVDGASKKLLLTVELLYSLHQSSWLTLGQVLACYLVAPRCYPSQCWLITNDRKCLFLRIFFS